MVRQSLEERYLKELYIDQLQDLYDSERANARRLPALVQFASSPELRRVLEYCLKQAEENIHHTEQILSSAGLCLDQKTAPTPARPVKLRLIQGGSP